MHNPAVQASSAAGPAWQQNGPALVYHDSAACKALKHCCCQRSVPWLARCLKMVKVGQQQSAAACMQGVSVFILSKVL